MHLFLGLTSTEGRVNQQRLPGTIQAQSSLWGLVYIFHIILVAKLVATYKSGGNLFAYAPECVCNKKAVSVAATMWNNAVKS